MKVWMSHMRVRRSGRNIRGPIVVLGVIALSVFGGLAPLDVRTAAASGIGIAFTAEPPASAVAGSPLAGSVVVSIQNDGTTITSGTGSTDTITIGSSCAFSPSSSLSETATAGIATFPSVTIDTGPSCALTATDTTTPDDGLTAVSSPVVISAGLPSHLAFTVAPPPTEVTAGTALAPFTVSVEDEYDNVNAIGVDSSDVIDITSPCALTGTTTLSAESGAATFADVVPTVSGACPLTAIDATRSIADASTAIVSPTLPPAPLKATRVTRAVVVGKATELVIFGSGFFGRPRVIADTAGVKALVTRDTGKVLKVVVTVRSTARRGIHILTIVLPNGKRTSAHFNVI